MACLHFSARAILGADQDAVAPRTFAALFSSPLLVILLLQNAYVWLLRGGDNLL